MGFYGNITNTSKTNFVFDKIYTNRKAMDDAQRKKDPNTGQTVGDGVFIGRYVLVEYGEITEDSFIKAYGPQEDGYYHIANNNEEATRILYTNEPIPSQDNYIKKGQIIYVLGIGGIYKFLECNGGVNKGEPSFSENPGLDPKTDPYFYNLKQDQAEYNVSRGYDGTVWVKTSVNNEIKYVNIAELNSVVPSFEMVADAPTMSPILPHFDTASNNVYYKLHWQPAWGMRIAEAEQKDGKIYSDYVTSWSQEFYDSSTGITTTKWYDPNKKEWVILDEDVAPPVINADIYFNHAAFDSQIGETNINKTIETNKAIYKPITLTAETYKRNKYYYKTGNRYYLDGSAFNTNRTYYEKLENYIGITADGLSGNKYNLHDGTSNTKQQVDTQQIHINLPAIGNMMSEAWDIIHGEKRDNSTVDSLQGRLNFFKDEIAHNEIPIQSSETEGYLVGSVINGAISYENSTDATNQDESVYNENILNVAINSEKPYEHDDAWIATNIDTEQGKDGDKDYHRKAISIHHTFHPRTDSAVNELNINNYDGKNGGSTADSDTQFQKIINKDTIQLYVPKVDKAGHVVGTDIDKVILPYGYKHIETIGNKIDNETTDLDTTQDTVSADKGTVTAGTPIGETAIVATETQDTVNIDPFNKWIQVKASDDTVEIAHEIHGIVTKAKETDLNNGTNTITFHDLEFDAAGHVEKNQLHTYTLPYGFKTIKAATQSTAVTDPSANTTEVIADSTQDTLQFASSNKWIKMSGTNKGKNINYDTFNIGHEVHPIAKEDNADTDLNDSTKYYSKTDGNTINVPDWEYDEAGHIKNKHNRKYTLPYGYKKIAAENSNAVTAAPVTTTTEPTANNTQDTLNLTASNKWIKFNTLDDTTNPNEVQIGHILSPIASDLTTTQLNSNEIEYKSTDTTINTFGGTFNILNFKTDNAGHIIEVGEDTITIPQGSAENINNTDINNNVIQTANLLSSINLDPESGKITGRYNTTNSIILSGYKTNKTNNHSNDVNDVDDNDTINTAFAKLQNQIEAEEKARQDAITALKVEDTLNNTQYVSGVSETDGKITVSRAGTDTLQLSNYSIASTGSDIKNSDTINEAFGKLQKQIKDIYGSEEIAESFDSIKDISDWLQANDSNADTIIDSIAKLTGEETVDGSVKKSIKDAIAGLDSSVAVSNNSVNYLTGITIVDGKIDEISEGTLGSAAFTESTNYATAAQGILADTAIQLDTEIAYKIQNDDGEGNIVEEELKTTIEEMAKEIASLKQVLKDNGLITE